MRKMSVVALLFMALGASVYGVIQAPLFQAKPFAEDTYVIRFYDTTDQLEPKVLDSQSYDFAFKDRSSKYEIRYILFAQVGSANDYKPGVLMWALSVVANITGVDPSNIQGSAFNDADVSNEFNADYGLTFFQQGAATDFTSGYKYVMINFFYKKGLGLACQAILFNDLAWARTQEFVDQFHSFNFVNKPGS